MRRLFARAALLPIRFYQKAVSPLTGPSCRFYPTCSHYAAEAIETHGALRGLALALARLARCHPWHRGPFLDPVPKRFAWRDMMGYKRPSTENPNPQQDRNA
jgi:putative membrane protein insertion efficiency factor